MKTTKLFFSIILVILATNSFSQQNFVRGKYFHNRDNKTTLKTFAYGSDHGRRSNWRHDLHSRTNDRFDRESYQVLKEKDDYLERWMIEPFDTFESPQIEEWMVSKWN